MHKEEVSGNSVFLYLVNSSNLYPLRRDTGEQGEDDLRWDFRNSKHVLKFFFLFSFYKLQTESYL